MSKQSRGADESTSLLESVATGTDSCEREFVLRHDFASHQYAQRFAPTRFLVSVFDPEKEGPSPYRGPHFRVCISYWSDDQSDRCSQMMLVSTRWSPMCVMRCHRV